MIEIMRSYHSNRLLSRIPQGSQHFFVDKSSMVLLD
jgi:hypothetical protein